MYRSGCSRYHSCAEAAATLERLSQPLSYHLRRGDIIAFRRELRTGSNPLVMDADGLTPLDAAFGVAEDLLIVCLCTSFPVDMLLEDLAYEALFPAKFASPAVESVERLYDKPLRHILAHLAQSPGAQLNPALPPHQQRVTFSAPKFQPKHDRLPSRAYQAVEKSAGPAYTLKTPTTMFLPPKLQSPKERQFYDTTTISVENSMDRPISGQIKARMKASVAKLTSYVDLCTELASCRVLLAATCQRRFECLPGGMLKAPQSEKRDIKKLRERLTKQKDDRPRQPEQAVNSGRNTWQAANYENLILDQSLRQPLPLFLAELGYPYLFASLLEILSTNYPRCPITGGRWRQNSPVDLRRLMSLTCHFKIQGYQIVIFLIHVAEQLCVLLTNSIPAKFFQPNPGLLDCLLSMAFALDCHKLFAHLLTNCYIMFDFETSRFDWVGTIDEMALRPDMYSTYLLPLLRVSEHMKPDAGDRPAPRELNYLLRRWRVDGPVRRDQRNKFATHEKEARARALEPRALEPRAIEPNRDVPTKVLCRRGQRSLLVGGGRPSLKPRARQISGGFVEVVPEPESDEFD